MFACTIDVDRISDLPQLPNTFPLQRRRRTYVLRTILPDALGRTVAAVTCLPDIFLPYLRCRTYFSSTVVTHICPPFDLCQSHFHGTHFAVPSAPNACPLYRLFRTHFCFTHFTEQPPSNSCSVTSPLNAFHRTVTAERVSTVPSLSYAFPRDAFRRTFAAEHKSAAPVSAGRISVERFSPRCRRRTRSVVPSPPNAFPRDAHSVVPSPPISFQQEMPLLL